MRTEDKRNIAILGGGVAGWWTACYLEQHHPDFKITVYDTDEIPILGVGESTIPQIKWYFDALGIKESEWFSKCHAVKKYGNYKQNWDHKDGLVYIQQFQNRPFKKFDEMMANENYWQDGKLLNRKIFDDLFEHPSIPAYWNSYHIPAEEIALVTKQKCKNVKLINERVYELPKGYDLYVDCTGLNSSFTKDKTTIQISPYHLVNKAWICPMQNLPDDKNVKYTKSIARSCGWSFEVVMTHRVGVGYVFSDKHISEEDALEEYKDIYKSLNRTPLPNCKPRLIQWEPKVLKNPWSDNVVALGSSAMFIDPLEAMALFNLMSGIIQLSKCLKKGYSQKVYNRQMQFIFKNGRDMQAAQYCLTSRTDTSFWREVIQGKDYYDKLIWDYYAKSENKANNYKDGYSAMTANDEKALIDHFYCTLGIMMNSVKNYRKKEYYG